MRGITEMIGELDLERTPLICVLLDADNYPSQRSNLYIITREFEEVLLVSVSVGLEKCREVLEGVGDNRGNVRIVSSMWNGPRERLEDSLIVRPTEITPLSRLAADINRELDRRKTGLLLFDSISTLYTYHPPNSVEKFIHYLTSKLRGFRVKGIFMGIEDDPNISSIKRCSQFFDKLLFI